ncbi:hypothetical protein GAO09_14660 [Rhizobiales bacterium RZME27]|uniref:Uncharacterized protein n=1 Tax=Endobacterium cereale TaxID=2663029 RepID=A0A6A8ABG3_9HYPH|nr:CrpP-related protein [Endobacterium cereale]MEB2843320.1 CrpP-related protein [Endobacterium cereale]MQY47278.1 hypothetical protein [Endobacterium cereale]
MTIETLLDWQERGINARILGLPSSQHPLLKADRWPDATGEPAEFWQMKFDAWMFGWSIEDSMRQPDTRVNELLICSAG